MAQAAVAPPTNERLLYRRESSLTEHVNRIRAANSKRSTAPWWWGNNPYEEKIAKDVQLQGKFGSKHSFSNFHHICIPEGSYEDLDFEYKQKHARDNHRFPCERKASLDSVDPSTLTQNAASDDDTKIDGEKGRKRTSRKGHGNESSRAYYQKDTKEDDHHFPSQRMAPSKSAETGTFTQQTLPDDDTKKEEEKIRKIRMYLKRKSSAKENLKTGMKKTSQKDSVEDNYFLSERAISLDSVKPSILRHKTQTGDNINTKGKKARKTSGMQKYDDFKVPEKRSAYKGSGNSVSKAKSKRKQKIPVSKRGKIYKGIKKEEIEEDQESEVEPSTIDKLDSGLDRRFKPYDLEESSNLEDSSSTKDIIIMKWLHEIKCPQSSKQNAEGSAPDSSESKKAPIRILKKPLSTNLKQNKNIPSENRNRNQQRASEISKTDRPKKKLSAGKNKGKLDKLERIRSYDKMRRSKSKEKATSANNLAKISISKEPAKNKSPTRLLKKPSYTLNFNQEEGVSSPNRMERKDIKRKLPVEEKEDALQGKNTSVSSQENVIPLHDVEMHVSELGKLQIIMNLKSLSPEDAAIIVWIDDLPKSSLVPDYHRRLSVTSFNKEETEHPERVLKSFSSPQLEDMATPRPNIYFPSVTVLKNIAVGSKAGLRTLNEDVSNSVLYKRCNLNHIDWEAAKATESQEKIYSDVSLENKYAKYKDNQNINKIPTVYRQPLY